MKITRSNLPLASLLLAFSCGLAVYAPLAAGQNVVNCDGSGGFGPIWSRCKVPVKATYAGGVCTVEETNVIINPGVTKPIVLVFEPPSAEFRFCPLLGDRIELKDATGSNEEQFDNAWAVDDPSPGDSGGWRNKACFPRFRIAALNGKRFKANPIDPTKPEGQYQYTVQFRYMPQGAPGTPCRRDPFIRNG